MLHLRQPAADESDGETDAAEVAEHGGEERDVHVFERVEQRGLLRRQDRSEALDRAPALGQASVHGRSSVARRRSGAQPAVAEWADRVGPRSDSLEQAGVPRDPDRQREETEDGEFGLHALPEHRVEPLGEGFAARASIVAIVEAVGDVVCDEIESSSDRDEDGDEEKVQE